jgi:hypothetical protein
MGVAPIFLITSAPYSLMTTYRMKLLPLARSISLDITLKGILVSLFVMTFFAYETISTQQQLEYKFITNFIGL